MATKKVSTVLKLQIPAGQASPAPPVGPALGQYGLNIMDFVNAYNQATQSQTGTIVPVEITVYEDRSFSFITKTPPAAVLLRQAAKIPKGSPESNRQKVGSVTRAQVRDIAEIKMPDLNANDIDAAMKIVEGTARSMGLLIAGEADLSVIQTTEEREAIEQAEAESAATEQALEAESVASE